MRYYWDFSEKDLFVYINKIKSAFKIITIEITIKIQKSIVNIVKWSLECDMALSISEGAMISQTSSNFSKIIIIGNKIPRYSVTFGYMLFIFEYDLKI